MKPERDVEELISRAADGERLDPEQVEHLREALQDGAGLDRARRWLLFERLLQAVIHRPDPEQLAAGKRRLVAQAAARAGVPLPGSDSKWHPGRLAAAGFLTFAAVVIVWLLATAGYPEPRISGGAEVLGGTHFVKGARLHAEGSGTLLLGGYVQVELFEGATLQRMGIPYREVLSLERGTVHVDHSGYGRISIRVADGRYRFTARHKRPARFLVSYDPRAGTIRVAAEEGDIELESLAGVTIIREGDDKMIRLADPPANQGRKPD